MGYELESDLETQVINYCTKRGWLCLKLRLVSMIGFPDRTIVTHTGVVFVELKRAKQGKASEAQKYWLNLLSSKRGCQAALVSTFEQFLELVGSHS